MKRVMSMMLAGIGLIISSFSFAYDGEINREEIYGKEIIQTPVKKEMKGRAVNYEEDLLDFMKLRTERFVKPDVCGECHPEIYKQWKGSMHSKAFVDPIWRAATKLFYSAARTPGEILEMKTCVKCHTPLGFRANLIQSPADDYDELSDLPAQGIFCNWCHNINEAVHIGDAGYALTPDTGEVYSSVMLGPRKDPREESPPRDPKLKTHPSEYSEFYTKSEFCGLCHNVSHIENKLPIEQTFDEWQKGPYNTKDAANAANCQDCHMRQKAGIPATGSTFRPDNPGKAAENGPYRDHVWTHYFAGGNSVVPKLLGSDIHSSLAIERLTNAAKLEIIMDGNYEKGRLAQIKVKVINSGAGHYLPTGMTTIRQMWLDIRITGGDGTAIFRSGAADNNGELEKDTVIFNTVLGDKNGNPVINLAQAVKVLYDHRIPPKEHVIENYSFLIPEKTVSPLKIEAVLKYRTISPAVLKKLLNEKADDFNIPVIDMASLSGKIDLF
ncbi:MAG: multiheme c-type cytochrome [bacterium]